MPTEPEERQAIYEPQHVDRLTPERARDVGAEGAEWRRELNQRLDRLDAVRPEDLEIRTR
jgi:hypothetical protein